MLKLKGKYYNLHIKVAWSGLNKVIVPLVDSVWQGAFPLATVIAKNRTKAIDKFIEQGWLVKVDKEMKVEYCQTDGEIGCYTTNLRFTNKLSEMYGWEEYES